MPHGASLNFGCFKRPSQKMRRSFFVESGRKS